VRGDGNFLISLDAELTVERLLPHTRKTSAVLVVSSRQMLRIKRIAAVAALVAYLCGGGLAGATPVFLCVPNADAAPAEIQPGKVDCCRSSEPVTSVAGPAIKAQRLDSGSEHRCPSCVDIPVSVDVGQPSTLQTPAAGKNVQDFGLPPAALPPLLSVRRPSSLCLIADPSPPADTLRTYLDSVIIRC
jgi:hypothetical protein